MGTIGRNYSLYAIWLLAGSVCILGASLVIGVVLLCAEQVLVAIKMEPNLSGDAGTFVAYLLPG